MLSRTFCCHYFNFPIFNQFIPRLQKVLLKIMDSRESIHIELLLKKLDKAERKARILTLELDNICEEISELKNSLSSTRTSNETSNKILAPKERRSILLNSLPSTSISVFDEPVTKKTKDEFDYSSGTLFNKENEYVIVYTDGSCENNGKSNAKAGIGVWFGDNHNLNISQPVNGKATNNTAEIQACVEALLTLHKHGVKKVEIHTDSQFTISCITKWIKNWKKNGWRTATGNPVKNKEDLEKLDAILSKFLDVKWVHVMGHNGVKGNEEADKLARQGAMLYRRK